jgi:hypothetical protein
MAQTFDNTAIENVMFLAKVKDNPATFSIKVNGDDTTLNRIVEWGLCQGSNSDIALDEPFDLAIDSAKLNQLEEFDHGCEV